MSTAAAHSSIAEHGLIGDLQTAALVSTDGTIDWYCAPRFDSPSVFAGLLDHERGGSFQIAPANDAYVVKQLYFPDTAVLITRFMSESGVAELIDFMPIADHPEVPTDRHRIVRIVRGIRGEMQLSARCAPRFDYARGQHTLEVSEHGAVFAATGGMRLTLHGAEGLEQRGPDLCLTHVVHANETAGVILETCADTPPRDVSGDELMGLFERTVRFWQSWIGHSTYSGRWREMVERSAITLKLMTYAPTGALVAAPTTALPEQLGGERNWDYRFTWVRDASFSVGALLALGFDEEAVAFMEWLRDRIDEQVGTSSGPLKIMYRVDGSSDLAEETLDHLSGYRDSRPVRIGNGAADQLQLDIYGEAMFALRQAGVKAGLAHRGWHSIGRITDWLCENWDQPDEGIWETRGGRRDFVYGRVMSWVALDTAVRMAGELGRPAELARWTGARDAVYRQILDRGWNADRRAFVQYPGTQVMDASILMMPLTGFVVPRDPLWISTLDAIEKDLVSDSLVYRYDPSASPDGLSGSEGTFSICTFWYVDALARSGRLHKARYCFEKMQSYANHLGLFAEEIGATGEQLGNFPQAFSHLSLIGAAVQLDAALKRQRED